jgi:hypothetical protein
MWAFIQRLLMLMLWMSCLSFAQEEKNELGLLLGAEFIPRAQQPLTRTFGGRMDARTRVKLLFQIGLQRRVSGLLHVREALAFRFSVQNSMISSSRED